MRFGRSHLCVERGACDECRLRGLFAAIRKHLANVQLPGSTEEF